MSEPRHLRSELPVRWQTLALVVVALVGSIGLAAKRGWLIGVVALAVYGGIALAATFRWEQLRRWSSRHPLADSAFVVPLLFLALAYITSLSLVMCVALSLAAGACLMTLGAALRARRA